MNNLSTHRKNNIYKIYSKLNDSYKRYITERDGQSSNHDFCKTKFNVDLDLPKTKPHIVNKPCSRPIVAIFKKKWYGEKWEYFYYKKKCKFSKFAFYNSKEKIEIYLKREQRLLNRKSKEADIYKRWRERKKIRLKKAKEIKKEKSYKRTEIQAEQKKQEIEYLIDLLDYAEKYKAIKNKNWVGITSRGSKYHFLGVESVDIVDLKREYSEAIHFGNKLKAKSKKIKKESIVEKLNREQKIIKQDIFERIVRETEIKHHLKMEKESIIKKDKHYEKIFDEFKEKLQAIKEQRWIGTTSNGSSYWFLGVEEVDIVDLKKQYSAVLKYKEEKKIKELQEQIELLQSPDDYDLMEYYEILIN